MPTIQDIRQQYPQYNDMSDQQLADSLHSKYYSDIPQEQFYQKIGITSQPPVATQQTNPSLLPRLGADLLAGTAQGGHQLLNIPSNAANFLANNGVISPEMANKVPRQKDYNYSQMLGVNNPNITDKAVQGIAQYAPAIPLGIAGNIAYAATQSDNPLTGGIAGAAGSLIGHGLGKAIPAAWNAGKNYFSQFAAQGLTKNIANDLNPVTNITNQQAFNLAKQNFDKHSNIEATAWNDLSDLAKQVDNSGAKFDNQNYINNLSNKLENLKGQSGRQSGFERSNKDAQTLLKDYMDDQHGTFTDAIEHNKALNQDYQNEITPGKSLPFNIVNYAKQNIKQAVDDNIQGNKLTDTLGDAWNNANSITAQKNKIFNEVVNPSGNQQISTFSKFAKGNSDFQDPTGFVKDYIPTARGDGVQKMEQFAQMLGDPTHAKNVIKMNYFDNALKNDGIDASKFLNKYNNLSSEQQNYLFSSPQNKAIQSLNKIMENNPEALKTPSIQHLIAHSTVPALIGATAGHALGIGGLEGALGGMAAIKGTQAGLGKLFENPKISNYFVNHLTQSPQTGGIAAPLINALVRPQITQGANYMMGGVAGWPGQINNQ